jgi:hypothetical protein
MESESENIWLAEITQYITENGWWMLAGIVLALILSFWLFSALSMRLACWFTLIEAKLTQCFRLSLSICLTKISLALIVFIFYLLHPLSLPIACLIAIPVGLFYIWRSIRRAFACKKRSAVTLMVMSGFSADLMMTAVVMALFSASFLALFFLS